MLTPFLKAVAAAIVIAGAALTTLFPPGRETPMPSLLATVCAAEDALFSGTLPVYIRNEIRVHPCETFKELGRTWMPMCSLKADGRFRMDRLEMRLEDEPYTVVDQAWYDPPTGRFIRVLETGDQVVFANAFDGEFVYATGPGLEGRQVVTKERIGESFQRPARPADFFGLAAGLRSGLKEDDGQVLSTEPGTLDDGTPVKVFKVGDSEPNVPVRTYWLFKVRADDRTVAQEVFFVDGQRHLVITRVSTETLPDASSVTWNLAAYESQLSRSDQPARASVQADMVLTDVSVKHMVEQADFETYLFVRPPAWTQGQEITDILEPTGSGKRMFSLTCKAEDGRWVVLVQGPLFNQTFGLLTKLGQVVYTSKNGFKAVQVPQGRQTAKTLLTSAGLDKPSKDRVSYCLVSPAETYPILAVNGRLTDEELHALIDSLVPAKAYLQNQP